MSEPIWKIPVTYLDGYKEGYSVGSADQLNLCESEVKREQEGLFKSAMYGGGILFGNETLPHAVVDYIFNIAIAAIRAAAIKEKK